MVAAEQSEQSRKKCLAAAYRALYRFTDHVGIVRDDPLILLEYLPRL
jgi:hypothetical protein